MRMKRIAILALALFAVSATVAWADFQAGSYKGHTKAKICTKIANGNCQRFRKGRISFKVHKTSNGSYLNRTKFDIRLTCSDGSHVNEQGVKIGGKLFISKKGNFSGVASNGDKQHGIPETVRTKVSGKLKGSHANGRLRRTEYLNNQNQDDPNGRKCTASTKWSAKKK